MEIAAVIGFGIACYGGGYISDVTTAHLIVRSRGTFVPEQRLISLVPGSLVSPVGCILLAFACAYQLHWVAIAFGFAMGKLFFRLDTHPPYHKSNRPAWLQFPLAQCTPQISP